MGASKNLFMQIREREAATESKKQSKEYHDQLWKQYSKQSKQKSK